VLSVLLHVYFPGGPTTWTAAPLPLRLLTPRRQQQLQQHVRLQHQRCNWAATVLVRVMRDRCGCSSTARSGVGGERCCPGQSDVWQLRLQQHEA
jgi:hypothetical protein